MDQHYCTGEEIHIGDRVRYAGCLGSIVFVIDRAEYSSDFPAEHWSTYQSGFMVQQDPNSLIMLTEADEDLEFISRAHPKR